MTYQQFEQPKAGLIVESFGWIDKEQQHEPIQDQWVCLHVHGRVVTVDTCQQAQAPQCPQEPSNLARD